jgi:hypothetical protein
MGDSPPLAFTPSLSLVAGDLRFVVHLASSAPAVLLPEEGLARLLSTKRPLSRRALQRAVTALGDTFSPRTVDAQPAFALPEALSVVGALLAQGALPVDARWMPAVLLAFQAAERAADETLRTLPRPTVSAPTVPAPPPTPTDAAPGTLRAHEAQQRQEILDALEATGWSRSRAAEHLGIPRRTLYRRMAQYGILEGARPRGPWAQKLRSQSEPDDPAPSR